MADRLQKAEDELTAALVELELANGREIVPGSLICYPQPPYIRWEPIKSSEGAIVAFTNRPCYRKGSHNHSICEQRFVREHPRDAKHPDYIKPQVN